MLHAFIKLVSHSPHCRITLPSPSCTHSNRVALAALSHSPHCRIHVVFRPRTRVTHAMSLCTRVTFAPCSSSFLGFGTDSGASSLAICCNSHCCIPSLLFSQPNASTLHFWLVLSPRLVMHPPVVTCELPHHACFPLLHMFAAPQIGKLAADWLAWITPG